ncbi:MAG TPA: sensor histidine kinase, partial [Candidatus Binatia bacterium]|nr:sensor histidine kinase [Candidatus Binatia bacterium]
SYCFRVTACNSAGVWNESGASLKFVVLPFIWQTWWFRLGVVGGFTLSVIAIVRYISFRRLRWQLAILEQQSALDKERTRISRDLHDDLGGSLTETALLLEMTERRPTVPDTVKEPLRHCSDLVRRVVKSVDEIIWAINPRNDTLRYLVDYISQFATEFLHAANLRCRVDLPDQLPERHVSPEVRHNLFLVVKEALNNIARHARAGEVWLRVKATDAEISFTVEDNGRGFNTVSNDAFADGLRNMRQRMEEIGGRFNLQSKPGSGTSVLFVYPWPKKK